MKRWGAALVATAMMHGAALAAPARACDPAQPVLRLWRSLAGAPLEPTPFAAAPGVRMPVLGAFQRWLSPTAVAVRGNYMYVVDSGRRQIFVYDQARQSMTVIPSYVAQAVTAIVPGPDLSLYVADTAARRVLQFAFDGRLLRSFASERHLAQPVGLALEQASATLLVADKQYRQILVFDSLGGVVAQLQPEEARSIDAMTRGPDGLYLVDHLQRQVLVIAPDGLERYALGQGTLGLPGQIAVDAYNRVYVSDQLDQTIKIYADGQLVDSAAGGAQRFGRIGGMWIERDTLYVADAGDARIVLLRIAAPCMGDVKHEKQNE